MSTFVLVPGAWLGAWAGVAEQLRAAGHDVVPVTLPGLAERADAEPAAAIDLTRHVEDVAGRLVEADLRGVVLVVHSYAGVLGAPVADRVPGRLVRVVYLATRPVPAGRSLFDLMGPEAEGIIRGMAAAAGDPDRIPAPAVAILEQYYPAHGMDGATLDHFLRRATPHPLRTHVEKVDLTGAGDAVPRALIWCTGDGPAPIGPATVGWTYRELPTGHWPMLTHPGLLAETLTGLA